MSVAIELVHGIPWYADGDIIIIATVGSLEHQFCIHRAILSIASHVFRDMLAMPQPTNAEHLDGIPLVRLSDPPGELSAVLRALYDGLYVMGAFGWRTHANCIPPEGSAIHDDGALTLDFLLAVLRMSTKYQMDKLRRGVIRLLREDWPLNYSDYRNRHSRFSSTGFRVADSIRVIEVGWKCEAPELLPPAFYELAASRLPEWGANDYAALRSILSHDDLRRLHLGQERSAQRLRALVGRSNFQWYEGENIWRSRDQPAQGLCTYRGAFKPCTKRTTDTAWVWWCPSLFSVLRNTIGGRVLAGESPFVVLSTVSRKDIEDSGACSPCVDWLTGLLATKQKEIWENIPVDFELPGIDPKLYDESMFKSL